MSRCVDNPATGRIGCGATYRGRAGHSVARVPWSTHVDGRAHVTFASERAGDMCWHGNTMTDPATDPRLEQDGRGYWRLRRSRTHTDGPTTAERGSNGQ